MKDSLSFCLVAAIVLFGVIVAFLPDRHSPFRHPYSAHTVVIVQHRSL